MTKAVSIRFPEDLVRRAKARAAESGTSFTAFVAGAIEARLEAPPLTAVPMAPVLAPRETVRGAPERLLPSPDDCAHPFRSQPANTCRICGKQL